MYQDEEVQRGKVLTVYQQWVVDIARHQDVFIHGNLVRLQSGQRNQDGIINMVREIKTRGQDEGRSHISMAPFLYSTPLIFSHRQQYCMMNVTLLLTINIKESSD